MPFVYLCPGCMRRGAKPGRCTECEKERWKADRERRGKTKARGYDSTHKAMAARVISQHPYCSDCGATTDLCADHIVPSSKGGANVLTNYRVLCRRCNTARATSE